MEAEKIDPAPAPHAVICPSCGKNNYCTMDENCWCMAKPRTGAVPREGACKCENCFDNENARQDAQFTDGSSNRLHTRLCAIAEELGIPVGLIAARGLRICVEAVDLTVAEVGEDGREHRLVAAAAAAWQRLRDAAQRDGVTVYIESAFRSVAHQAEIVRTKLNAGITIEEALTVCAPPGYSEHHTGRAVDVSTPGTESLEEVFDQSAAFAWLTNHAREFGFYLSYPLGNPQGYQYEPWHWCYHDIQVA